MSSKQLFPVGVDVIVIRDNKLLLGQRNHGFGNGTWGLPGGHLELREGIEQAALRELHEETGLTAHGVRFVSIFNNNNRDQHYVHFTVEALDAAGEVKLMEPDKFASWQWFDLAKLSGVNIFPPHAPQIQAFIDGVQFIGNS